MNGLRFSLVGIAIALAALLALFVAAEAQSGGTYWAALGLFVVATLMEFALIKKWFDRQVTPLRQTNIEAN